MTVKEQIQLLGDLVGSYASRKNALDTAFEETGKVVSFVVEFDLIKVEFVYTKKASTLCPVRTLFCRIFLHKNSPYFYEIPEIIDFLNLDDFHCYVFPGMENEERVTACFSFLCRFLDDHRDALGALGAENEKWENEKRKTLKMMFAVKEETLPSDEETQTRYFLRLSFFAEQQFLLRSTNFPAYRFFLDGKYEKSLEKYQKVKNLFPYEERLIAFMRTAETPYDAVPDKCDSRNALKRCGSSKKNFLLLLVSWIACMLLLSLPFAAALLITGAVWESKTSYADLLPLWSLFLFAGVPGLIFGTAAWKKLAGFVFKNDQEMTDFSDILFPKSTFLFFGIAGSVVLCGMIVLFVLSVKPTFCVYDDHTFSYTLSDGSGAKTDDLSEIESVYHIAGRYNDYGNYIKRGSYVIVLKDGTQIDTDAFNRSNEKHLEKSLLPLLDKEVISVKSEKDIPTPDFSVKK